VIALDAEVLTLASAQLDLRQFERRDGEVLLRTDVLGHRLIDVGEARLVRATDLELACRDGRWLLTGVDVGRSRRCLGLFRGGTADHLVRDWKHFEPLIGHVHSAVLRGAVARIRGLKPAQIADLLEEASTAEENEILGQVHVDPELEADVFEELGEDLQCRLLGARTDADIAEVLARMRADDAADAIHELPQRRRQPVLDLLPAGTRTKILTLMGYNHTSAGGLMDVDFLVLPADTAVRQALQAVRGAHTVQPQALTSLYTVDATGRLTGVVLLVGLVQANSEARLVQVAESDPIRVHPDTDMVDVALLMADYNLLTLPVVDDAGRPLGVITVDDVLDAALPEVWRRREPPTHTDSGIENERNEPADSPGGGQP
ncbi:MAG: magnesium transporter, partial [Kutzneria sp.]|nr:magnesium transporter [Kutzneria sp.]